MAFFHVSSDSERFTVAFGYRVSPSNNRDWSIAAEAAQIPRGWINGAAVLTVAALKRPDDGNGFGRWVYGLRSAWTITIFTTGR